jgi:hypothetical protein
VLSGTRFEAVSSIQQAVMTELKVILEEAFSWALVSLYERSKPAKVGGDHIE